MKGVELPINILVIVAIAVIVLLGLVALYFTGFGPFSATAGQEAIKNQACVDLNPRAGCIDDPSTIVVNYDVVDKDTGADLADNWQTFADQFYGCAGDSSCARRICGCPGY